MSAPMHCPFCAEEDLRPSESASQAWLCRACAREFTVTLLRVAQEEIPGRLDPSLVTG